MMASKEGLGRFRRVDLSTMQRRLRHLRSVSARNISPKFAICGSTLQEYLLETYFTLHPPEDRTVVYYRSEKIKNSLNPTWVSFEPSKWSEELNTALTTFVICVWGMWKGNHKLLMEWKVNLAVLQYIGDQVRNTKYAPNTLIFGLADGFYWAGETNKISQATTDARLAKSNSKLLKSDIEQVSSSYSLSLLTRFQTISRAIRQTRISTYEVKRSIRERLQELMQETSEVGQQESIKLKLKLLREELTSKGALLGRENDEEKKCNQILKHRKSSLDKRKENLAACWSRLKNSKQTYIDKRESLVKLNAQLSMRRRYLASELIYIYPIIQLDSEEFVVCGVKFPNCESEKFFAADEETLSVALGYVCHLVYMIAKLLELPLRYPMVPAGSRSFAVDYTIEKVADRDREFPLYTKGKEKIQFYYGVFLLNKNIGQLRQFCGLPTQNLRNTLPNLKDLLDTRFRASEPLNSPPMPIVGPSPNLKPRSTSSGGSTESPPRNPQLDDIILRNMNSASLGGIKPPLPPKPLLPPCTKSELSQIKTPQQTAAHKFIGKRSIRRSASLKQPRNSRVNPNRDISREERDNILLEKEMFLQRSASSLNQTKEQEKENYALVTQSNLTESADPQVVATQPSATAQNMVSEHQTLKIDSSSGTIGETPLNSKDCPPSSGVNGSVDVNASRDIQRTRAEST